MAMQLEVAHDMIASDPAGAERLVGQLHDQTRADIGEVRRLVEGLRPPALDQLGLVSALKQRAADHNHAANMVAGRKPMTWTVQAEADLEPLPAAVEVAAYRIVLESVHNALQHGQATTCTVTLRRGEGNLEIEVRDDGVGLEAVRVPGVGLESMQERAEELGGSCVVSSQCHARNPGACTPAADRVERRTTRGVVMEQLRIMVVDDHDDFRHGLEALLASNGGTEVVGSADNGQDAVRTALALQPDVVLMDLHMPRLNGIEATEQIVRSSPHIGVLVLTMMEDEESVFAAIRAGARGYLLKGARRSEIVRSIEAVGAGEVIFGPAIAERVTAYFRGVQAPAAAELFPELTDREKARPAADRARPRQRRDRT